MSGTINFPYRYITGLPPKAQQELWENFQKLAAQFPAGTKVYDAYVDASVSTDNTTTRTFHTVFAAIKYVADTVGKNIISIGWLRSTSAGGNTSTETASYGGTLSGLQVSVEVVGPLYIQSSTSNETLAEWDWQGFTDNGKFSQLNIHNVWWHSTLANTTQSPLTGSNSKMFATDCVIDFQQHTCIVPGYYRDTRILGAGFNVSANTNKDYHFLRCSLNGTLGGGTIDNGSSGNRGVYLWDCNMVGVGSLAINCQEFVAMNTIWTVNSNWGGGGSLIAGTSATLTNGSAPLNQRIMLTSIGESGVANQSATINFTQPIDVLYIEGNWWSITVPAPTGVGGTNGNAHHIHANVTNSFDITGPADVSIRAMTGGNKLRGEGVTAKVMAFGNKGAGNVALALIGLKHSVVQAALQAYGTAGTGQGYTIDAASTNCTLLVEGDDLFPGASSNSSTSVGVMSHTGSTPAGTAGPWLAGTYPSPRVGPDYTQAFQDTPNFDARSIRHITISPVAPTSGQVLNYNATTHKIEWTTNSAVDATAVHSGDSAGPWMAGTFPSPRPGPDFTQQFLISL